MTELLVQILVENARLEWVKLPPCQVAGVCCPATRVRINTPSIALFFITDQQKLNVLTRLRVVIL